MSRVTTTESALQSGNSAFVDENFNEALEHYNTAIELDSDNIEAYLKRSACYHKLEQFEESLEDANAVLKKDQNNTKALLRKGIACFELEEYESAKSSFEKALQIEPNNSSFKTWLRKCNAELEAEGQPVVPSTTTNTTNNTTVSETKNTSTNTTTTTPASTSTPSSSSSNPPPSNNVPPQYTQTGTLKIRHEWYQTATHVYVSILAKNVKQEDANIDIKEKTLNITIKLPTGSEYQLDLDLNDRIVPSSSNVSYLSTKIEIKLQKANPSRWKSLEDSGEAPTAWDSVTTTPTPSSTAAPTTTTTAATASATSKGPKKNWDKIVDDIAKTDKLDDEDSLNKVFQQIYANGSEEQRRAMMKSFVESGGTVLSTNWDEVGNKQVKGSPPQGMEMKYWKDLEK